MQQQPIIFSFTMSPSSAMSPVCDKAHRPAASAGPLIALWQKDTCPVPTNRQPPKAGKYETHKGNFADERRRSIGEVSFLLLNQCPAAGILWREPQARPHAFTYIRARTSPIRPSAGRSIGGTTVVGAAKLH